MAEIHDSAPHLYFSVTDLSKVKDVGTMKNRRVKTVGYIIKNKGQPVVKESPGSARMVLLDLRHINNDIVDVYPYVIFGNLCMINGTLVIAAKSTKRFGSSLGDLAIYKKHNLILRNRLKKS